MELFSLISVQYPHMPGFCTHCLLWSLQLPGMEYFILSILQMTEPKLYIQKLVTISIHTSHKQLSRHSVLDLFLLNIDGIQLGLEIWTLLDSSSPLSFFILPSISYHLPNPNGFTYTYFYIHFLIFIFN